MYIMRQHTLLLNTLICILCIQYVSCQCALGYYEYTIPGTKTKACTSCPRNYYGIGSPGERTSLASGCARCPDNSYTLQDASDHISDCLCGVGYWGIISSESPNCLQCTNIASDEYFITGSTIFNGCSKLFCTNARNGEYYSSPSGTFRISNNC